MTEGAAKNKQKISRKYQNSKFDVGSCFDSSLEPSVDDFLIGQLGIFSK